MFDVRLSKCLSACAVKSSVGEKHSPNDRKRNLTNCHPFSRRQHQFPLYRTCVCVLFAFDDVMMAPADFLTAYHVIYIKFTFFPWFESPSVRITKRWKFGLTVARMNHSNDITWYVFKLAECIGSAETFCHTHSVIIYISKPTKKMVINSCGCWWLCIFLIKWLKIYHFSFFKCTTFGSTLQLSN